MNMRCALQRLPLLAALAVAFPCSLMAADEQAQVLPSPQRLLIQRTAEDIAKSDAMATPTTESDVLAREAIDLIQEKNLKKKQVMNSNKKYLPKKKCVSISLNALKKLKNR